MSSHKSRPALARSVFWRRSACLVALGACVLSACRYEYGNDEQIGIGTSGAAGSSESGGRAGGGVSGSSALGGATQFGGASALGGAMLDGAGAGGDASTTAGTAGVSEPGGSGNAAGAPENAGAGGVSGGSGGGGSGGTSGGGGSGGASGGAGSGGGGSGGAGSGGGGSGGTGSGGGGAGGSGGGGDLVVTTNADENDAGATVGMPGGTGLSLREAINIANSSAGTQTITFAPGIVVAQTSAQPAITDPTNIVGGVINAAAVPVNKNCLTINVGPSVVDGLEMYGCRGRTIYVFDGAGSQIKNTKIHDCTGTVDFSATGLDNLFGPGNVVTNIQSDCVGIYSDQVHVFDNTITYCSGNGIYISATSKNTSIIGNALAYSSYGVNTGIATTGIVLWHNSVVANIMGGLALTQASSIDLRNNIMAYNAAAGVAGTDAKFTFKEHNLYFGNAGGNCSGCTLGGSAVQADPKFTNWGGGDFTLQSGSPAIDVGAVLGTDRNGAAAGDYNGAAPDLGAFEK